MFEAICDHIKLAEKDGTIQPTITLFRQRQHFKPDLRIWNRFVLGYAGYDDVEENVDGNNNQEFVPGSKKFKKVGDQANLSFTKVPCVVSHLTHFPQSLVKWICTND